MVIERTILDGPHMRFLILAAALAFTASPALGQFWPEILHWAEQGNASVQTRLGLMYDLGRDVPQDDTEAGRWKPILIGAGIGLTLGYLIGGTKDDPYDGRFVLKCAPHIPATLGRNPISSASLEVW